MDPERMMRRAVASILRTVLKENQRGHGLRPPTLAGPPTMAAEKGQLGGALRRAYKLYGNPHANTPLPLAVVAAIENALAPWATEIADHHIQFQRALYSVPTRYQDRPAMSKRWWFPPSLASRGAPAF